VTNLFLIQEGKNAYSHWKILAAILQHGQISKVAYDWVKTAHFSFISIVTHVHSFSSLCVCVLSPNRTRGKLANKICTLKWLNSIKLPSNLKTNSSLLSMPYVYFMQIINLNYESLQLIWRLLRFRHSWACMGMVTRSPLTRNFPSRKGKEQVTCSYYLVSGLACGSEFNTVLGISVVLWPSY
jgi:hypothetical protein